MVISILEDNPMILDDTYKMVCTLRPDCTVNRYSSISRFLLEASQITDILISDICLDDGDAIEALINVQQKNEGLRIIYMTGYIENSKRIFQTRPSYFLVKPFCEDELSTAIEKCENEIECEREDIVLIPTKGGNVILRKKRIKYIESNGRKVIVHKIDGQVEYYGKLDSLYEDLKGSFLRCHKSYIVNMAFIKAFVGTDIVLVTEEILPVSRSYHNSSRNEHTVYLGGLLK